MAASAALLLSCLGSVPRADPGSGCALQSGVEFVGSDVAAPQPAADAAACCGGCRSDAACKFFTWCELGGAGVCLRKGEGAPGSMRHNSSCSSGLLGFEPPVPPVPGDVSVTVGGVRWQGGRSHVCWNIDASINRGFFRRNLSAAVPHSEGWQLAWQAAAIGAAQEAGFSLLRFGGSVWAISEPPTSSSWTPPLLGRPEPDFRPVWQGNDYLTYEFGGYECPPALRSKYKQCLNQTQWTSLLSFTAAAKARMVLGLSMNIGQDLAAGAGGRAGPPVYPYPWDPGNARALLQWTIDQR
jgi:hypothetical protein